MDRLVLVRHAMPVPDPDVPSERWRLGEPGRAAARALRAVLPPDAYLVASDEPKAVQTLQEAAGQPDVATDPDFGEVRRPYVWAADEDYRSVARAYVEGAAHAGWEPHAAVAARFGAAVARHAALAGHRTLVVGTHGLSPTVWLAGVVRLEPSPAGFWQSLGYPDVVDVDLAAGRATRRAGP